MTEQTEEFVETDTGEAYSPDAPVDVDLENDRFSMQYRKPEYPVTVMLPYTEGYRGPIVAALLYLAKHLDVGFELVGNTEIDKARNELANRFLYNSDAEWSFWLDADVFMPFGNEKTFMTYSGMQKGQKFSVHNALTRMMGHRHPLIGGVYAGRFKRAPLTIQPDLEPRNETDRKVANAIRNGEPAVGGNACYPVEWVAAGLMLVHRKVFTTIMETQPVTPNFEGEYYPFFTRFSDVTGGEDVAFCVRAKRAGAQPVLDTAIRAGHIGFNMFMPEDSQPPAMRGRG
jgi:hypothetical protein